MPIYGGLFLRSKCLKDHILSPVGFWFWNKAKHITSLRNYSNADEFFRYKEAIKKGNEIVEAKKRMFGENVGASCLGKDGVLYINV